MKAAKKVKETKKKKKMKREKEKRKPKVGKYERCRYNLIDSGSNSRPIPKNWKCKKLHVETRCEISEAFSFISITVFNIL